MTKLLGTDMFLDTSYCIDLLREGAKDERGPATAKLRELGETPLYASLFVWCELHAGARLSAHPDRELAKVHRLAELIEIVVPNRTFPVACGETEAHLRRNGFPIPTMDLLIGVLAKSHGLPLLTRDGKHFRHIPGLVVEEY